MPAIVWDILPAAGKGGTECWVYLRKNDKTVKIQKDLRQIFLSRWNSKQNIEKLKSSYELNSPNIKTGIYDAGEGRWFLEIQGPRSLDEILDKSSFRNSPSIYESFALQTKPFSLINDAGDTGEQASVEDICNQTVAVLDIEKQDWEPNSGRTPKICAASIGISKPDGKQKYYTTAIWPIHEEGVDSEHLPVRNPLELALLTSYILRKEDPGFVAGQNIQKYDFEELKMNYRGLFTAGGRKEFFERLKNSREGKDKDLNLEDISKSLSELEHAIEHWYETGEIKFENRLGFRVFDEFTALLSYIGQMTQEWAATGVRPFYLQDRPDKENINTTLLKLIGQFELPEQLKDWLAEKYSKGTKANLKRAVESGEELPEWLQMRLRTDFSNDLEKICRHNLAKLVKEGVFLLGIDKEEPGFRSSSYMRKQHCAGLQIIDTYTFSHNHLDLPNDKLPTIIAHFDDCYVKALKHGEITPFARAAEAGDKVSGTKLVKYNLEDVKATLKLTRTIMPTEAELARLYETDFATVSTTSIGTVQDILFKKQNYGKKRFWRIFYDAEKDVLEEKFRPAQPGNRREEPGLGFDFKAEKGNFEQLTAIYPAHIFRALEALVRSNPCGEHLLKLFEAETRPTFKIIYAQHLDKLCTRLLYDTESMRDVFALEEQTSQNLKEKVITAAEELKDFLSKHSSNIVNASKRLAFLKGLPNLESELQANPNLYFAGIAEKVSSGKKGRIAAGLNGKIYSSGITLDRMSRKGDLSYIDKIIREETFDIHFSKLSTSEKVSALQNLFSSLEGQIIEHYFFEDRPNRPLSDYSISYTNTRRYQRMELAEAKSGEIVIGAYILNKGFVPYWAIEEGDKPDLEVYRTKLFGPLKKDKSKGRNLTGGVVGDWLLSMFNAKGKYDVHSALSRLCECRAHGADLRLLAKSYDLNVPVQQATLSSF
jgi:hypothetical protein